MFNIAGFNIVSSPRNTRGGGLAIYIRKKYNFECLTRLNMMEEQMETLFISVNDQYLIGCIYRPPNCNFSVFLDALRGKLEFIRRNCCDQSVVLHGDFNINLLNRFCGRSLEFISLMFQYGFFPVILRPTRVGSRSATLIDHIWTDSTNLFRRSGIVLSDISDHFPVCSNFAKNMKSDVGDGDCDLIRVTHRVNSPLNRASLAAEIERYDWGPVKDMICVNEAYNSFSDVISLLYDKHFPMKTKLVKRLDIEKPFINNELKALLKEKHRLQKLYHKWPISYSERYKKIRNELSSRIRKARSNYYRNKLSADSTKTKGTWKIVNNLLGRHGNSERSTQIYINGELTDDPGRIADGFNEYFSYVGAELASHFEPSDDFLDYLPRYDNIRFTVNPVTVEDVSRVLLSLSDSSPGHDGLPMHIFKDNITSLVGILTFLCNLSFSSGVFPDKLMIARVVCIFKKGDPKDVSNYRPISVLSAFSKILEKLMAINITRYFNDFSLFSASQYGFRNGLSTVDATLSIVNSLYESFDRREVTVGVFVDLAKAFDSLDREKLFKKLSFYGIGGIELRWIQSYFSNRRQYVRYQNVCSSMRQVPYGTAQGSVLGPLLFIIFMNDISRCSSILKFVIYADDTNVFTSLRDPVHGVNIINAELSKLSLWMRRNTLTLNDDKTYYVLFHRKYRKNVFPNLNILMNGCPVERVTEVKFLGLYLDENLNFKYYTSLLVRKLSKFLPIIYNIRDNLTLSSLKLIYNSLIYPNLLYCNCIWGASHRININPLIVLQKKIVRIMTFNQRNSHTRALMKSLSILDIDDIYRFSSGCTVYRHLNSGKETFVPYVCPYNTRRSEAPTLTLPVITTTHSRQSLRWRGVQIWNELPADLRLETSYNSFKRKFKYILLQ